MLTDNKYEIKKSKKKNRLIFKQSFYTILLSLIISFQNYGQNYIGVKIATQINPESTWGGGLFYYNNKIVFSQFGDIPGDGNKPSNVGFLCNTNLDTILTQRTSVSGNVSGNTFLLLPFGINSNSKMFYSGFSSNYYSNSYTHIFAKSNTTNLNLTTYKTYKARSFCFPGSGFKKMLNDSTFVISRLIYNGPSNSIANFSLWWLNKNLDTLNQKVYINNKNFAPTNCFNLPNKELLVVGNGDSIAINDAFVMKLDSFGNVKWAKSIGTMGRDGFFAEKINNNIYLIGNANVSSSVHDSYSEIVLTKIDTGGNVIKTFKIITDHVIWAGKISTLKNTIVMAAESFTTNPSIGERKGLFLKIDTNGIVQKQYVIGTLHTNDENFSAVAIVSDSLNNIFCNYQTWTGSSTPKNYLLKLDSNLVGCYPSEPALNFTTTVVPGYLHNIPIHFRVAKDSLYEVFGTINQGHGFNTLVDECFGYVGLKDLATTENIHFKVYPNPSAGVFYYTYNSEVNNNSPATLTIIDMLGKVIIKGEINSNNSTGKIDLSDLTNGIYFINVSTATKQLFNNKLSVNR